MKRVAILLLVLSLLFSSLASAKDWVEYTGGDGPGTGKHIVLASGDEEYRSEEALPMLGKILARHGFRCTVLFAVNPDDGTIDPNNKSNIPGFERIADADLVILFLRMRELPDEQMQHLVNHLNAGKPLLGLRTATHAFQYEPDSKSKFARFDWRKDGGFGQEVFGETWVSHHGQHGKESARGLINGMHEAHPVLRGVRDIWGPTDVYGVKHLPEDAKVLVYGQVLQGMKPDDPPNFEKSIMPMIWQRDYKAESGKTANILCSTIGSGPDFECQDLRRVVVNFSYWSLGLAEELPDKANVDYVGEYKPTYFGFDKAKKGVRPSDHELH